jgi:hypothetical protein
MASVYETIGDLDDNNNQNCADPNSATCDPCNKIISSVFDKYGGLFQTMVVAEA